MSRPPLHPKHKDRHSKKPIQSRRTENMAIVAQGLTLPGDFSNSEMSQSNNRSFSAEDRQKYNRKPSSTRNLRKVSIVAMSR